MDAIDWTQDFWKRTVPELDGMLKRLDIEVPPKSRKWAKIKRLNQRRDQLREEGSGQVYLLRQAYMHVHMRFNVQSARPSDRRPATAGSHLKQPRHLQTWTI
jgi:hypothetical protein